MANIYEYSSYKEFIRDLIKENSGHRGYQAKLARAAGCQPSYLSQALTGKAELHSDHAAKMAVFLGMTPNETEFLIELVHLAKATSTNLKNILLNKIERLKKEHTELAHRISGVQKISESIENFYFSTWFWSAIHVATSVPEYQTASALAERFHLPLQLVHEVLEKLQKVGFVQYRNSKWQYQGGAAHLARESFMTEMNHMHWRQRALLDVQIPSTEALHYTSVFTMSKSDATKIRELLIETIKNSRLLSDPSEAEEIFCMNFDFFKV
jgi:uncharacterized protein (TIGR02147 family)